DVKVEEEDGQVTQWQVASNSIPYLTRKGQIRYTTAMGLRDKVIESTVN
ncbi:fimbria/pilus outer membrane usher protein, partial [Escherichia coli]